MEPRKKLALTLVWGTAVLVMVGVVGTGVLARRQMTTEADLTAQLPVLFNAPKFELTDQNGHKVTDQTLLGDVWVAMPFFASCPGVCPMMTAKMLDLQKAVPLPDVKIMSMSIDPDHDTPEVLKGYAEALGADQSRWFFVSTSKAAMFDLVTQGFKLAAAPAHDNYPISHTTKALLIDRENRVRGSYDTTMEEDMKKLASDARLLAGEKEIPS